MHSHVIGVVEEYPKDASLLTTESRIKTRCRAEARDDANALRGL